MNKSELVDAIASSSGSTKVDSARFLDVLLETITIELSKGNEVVLPGFGSFRTGSRSKRMGRNPQTGEVIEIPPTTVAKFRVGKLLKEAVQRG